uniref:Uncharacterized protein n=1 Tax=Anguilla anguilla TaxID=7936 RepID=A0A0E9RR67_ANGAN
MGSPYHLTDSGFLQVTDIIRVLQVKLQERK